MTSKELKALIVLLEDPDNEVFKVVSDRIIVQGPKIVSKLEKSWEECDNELMQERIENLIHTIQLQSTKTNLIKWVETGSQNLLEGAYLVASYQYPDLDLSQIDKAIETIKNAIWQEFNQTLTPLEKVKTLNHIIYGINNFSGNTTDFFSPDNHFINRVLESKKGGPVSLAIIYSCVAQKLGLPIYCVSLPRNFILAYVDRYTSSKEVEKPNGNILFYINPFNSGKVIGIREIENYLEQHNVEHKVEYFQPCTNRTTISQLIASLMIAFQKINQPQKVSDLQEFLNITNEQRAS